MYYGKFGLANYTKSEIRQLNDADLIDYFAYPFPLEDNIKNIVFACKKSIFGVYSSIWRMIAKPVMGVKYPDISHFDSVKRRVEAVYLDDLLPNCLTHKVWHESLDEILKHLSTELKQIGSVCRTASVRLVIHYPSNAILDKHGATLLNKLWKVMGYPKQTKNKLTNHRFYVSVDSLRGASTTDKAKYLSKLSTLHDKLCLVASSSFMDTMKICKEFKYKVRPSFDIEKHRNKQGKRIAVTTKEWEVFENFWRSDKNGSVMLPMVFCSKDLEDEGSTKLVKHYVRKASVVFY